MKIKISEIKKDKRCEYKGCRKLAKNIVYRRGYGLGVYCDKHAEILLDEEWIDAEYLVNCPNCGCGFGVN